MTSVLTPELGFDYQVLTIKGKKLTTALFGQLFQQQPFNDNYELQYAIVGRVYKNKQFVVFTTLEGVRKFDITYFLGKEREHSLGESIYSCLNERVQAYMELEKVKHHVRHYYSGLIDAEREEPTYVSGILESLLNGTGDYYQREEHCQVLMDILQGEFKLKLERAYEQGLQKKRNFNKLVETFVAVPQIFI